MENLPEALTAAGVGIEVFRRVLGPPLQALGDALERWSTYQLRNVGRVIRNAGQKLGDRADEKGAVAERAAIRIFQEAGNSDDEVIVDYLGGVLASSRTPGGRDDRGSVMTALISRLSTYQLRTHYVLYTIMRDESRGQDVNLYEVDERRRAAVFIPYNVYEEALRLAEGESFGVLIRHSLVGLESEDLIHMMLWGDRDHLNDAVAPEEAVPGDGLVVSPTALGGDLFLWGMGQGQRTAEEMFHPDLDVTFLNDVPIVPGSVSLRALRDARGLPE